MENFKLEKRNIFLPNGKNLEVEVTPKFLEIVSSHFGVSSPNDDHIRAYIWGALKNAIDKAGDDHVHSVS